MASATSKSEILLVSPGFAISTLSLRKTIWQPLVRVKLGWAFAHHVGDARHQHAGINDNARLALPSPLRQPLSPAHVSLSYGCEPCARFLLRRPRRYLLPPPPANPGIPFSSADAFDLGAGPCKDQPGSIVLRFAPIGPGTALLA